MTRIFNIDSLIAFMRHSPPFPRKRRTLPSHFTLGTDETAWKVSHYRYESEQCLGLQEGVRACLLPVTLTDLKISCCRSFNLSCSTWRRCSRRVCCLACRAEELTVGPTGGNWWLTWGGGACCCCPACEVAEGCCGGFPPFRTAAVCRRRAVNINETKS